MMQKWKYNFRMEKDRAKVPEGLSKFEKVSRPRVTDKCGQGIISGQVCLISSPAEVAKDS